MSDKQGTIRQILVITDGCSNVGDNPVQSAEQARKRGITVNVIGVVDKGDMGKQGKQEAMSVADAGGGMCRIVQPTEVSATAQMMTHQTMQMTLQDVVNQELLQVMGKTTEELPPAERSRVVQVVDKLEEEVNLRVVVAVDTSASMRDKLGTVREAIRDLSLSFQVRTGTSNVAVLIFPGSADEMVKTVHPFRSELDMKMLESMLIARGGTPTGPAIDYAVTLFSADDNKSDFPDRPWTEDWAASE
ncbi:VWA domain-containing protein [Alicyclobacillus sp. SO9]|uniref:VWA domain-containing protein n=1 Tax=Alicyclobacillus sp. SO9 TaxID=2665646 RepID=UPI001E4E0C67|nr:VWA domain-containing protein [Alicyclobacillus sp. SO9]